MSDEASLVVNIVVNTITTLGYVHLFLEQLRDVATKRDYISPLRMIILIIFAIALTTLIPVTIYQYSKLLDVELTYLYNTVLVLSPLNRVATLGLLYWFKYYRIRKG